MESVEQSRDWMAPGRRMFAVDTINEKPIEALVSNPETLRPQDAVQEIHPRKRDRQLK